MNRAESLSYEPTGAGWLWTVKELVRPVTGYAKWKAGPVLSANRRGPEPQIRAPYTRALWDAICAAKRPMTRSEWINRAALTGDDRRLACSAIVNLVNGKWVRERNGKFRRIIQPDERG